MDTKPIMANLLSYKKISLLFFIFVQGILFPCTIFSQIFAPQAGLSGTSAISKDSNIFVAWANNCVVKRGYINISDTTATYNGSNKASFGSAELATGYPGGTMDVVSLGDSGFAILSFNYPICNGEGADFAVFENGLIPQNQPDKAFLELAFVSVSSDSIHFITFPPTSLTPVNQQISAFDNIDARYINNLAGKYIANFGTPFDLDELKNSSPFLDVNNIKYVKITDVVGSINPNFASYDAQGNIINDPFPTPFASCGFDLDAVGVIHQKRNNKSDKKISLSPNPAQNFLYIHSEEKIIDIKIYNLSGKCIISQNCNSFINQINLTNITNGLYFVIIKTDINIYKQKLIILKNIK
jgi:hypothetical protein